MWFLGLLVAAIIIYALFKEDINLYIRKYKRKNSINNENIIVREEVHEEEKSEEDRRIVIESIKDLENEKVEEIEEVTVEAKEYVKPNIGLLTKSKNIVASEEDINKKKEIINDTFNEFNVKAKVSNVYIGSLASVYEIELGKTKIEKVESVKSELSLHLGTTNIRILKPIPGKNTLGIEIPNKEKGKVFLRNMLNSIPSEYKNAKVLIPLGMDTCGEYHYIDLNEYQNLLVTGGHNSGKTCFLHSIILTNLLRSTPEELKFILIDARKGELEQYERLTNIYSSNFDGVLIDDYLIKIYEELLNRTKILRACGFSNIDEYNSKYPEQKICRLLVVIDAYQDFFSSESNRFVINELIHSGKESGINLIVSSNNTYAKFEHELQELDFSSISLFQTKNDFKYNRVKDDGNLIGVGDSYHKVPNNNLIIRTQTPYVSFEDIKSVVNFIKLKNITHKYSDVFAKVVEEVKTEDNDPVYDEVLDFAIRTGQISASLIQRRFKIGYNRSARLIDKFEERGIVGPPRGDKPREVLVKYKEEE